MRNLIRVVALLGLAVPAFAASSVNVTSSCTPGGGCPAVALPNAAPFTTMGNNSQRWEFRLHASSFTNESLIDIGPFQLYIGSGMFQLTNAINPPTTDTLAPLDPLIPCCTGLSDIEIRIMRDVPNMLYTLQVCVTATSSCQSSRFTISVLGTAINWDVFRVEFESGFDVAWFRWFSTLVDPATIIMNTNTAGTLDWEFESTLADSVIGLTFSNPGVTYSTTPVFNPSCRPFFQQALKTGVAGSVTAVGLCQALDGGAAPTPTWSYLGTGSDGVTQPSLVLGSSGSLTTSVSGQIKGSVNLNLHLVDGSGNASDTVVHDGAVTVDANDNVITGLPLDDFILGKLLRYGSPNLRAPWFDDRNKVVADLQGSLLSVNFPDYWDTFQTGTVRLDASQTCGNSTAGTGIVGTGTHFTSFYKYGSSTTSQAITTGSKTFTTQAGLGYIPSTSYARITSAANPANFMSGFVTAYTGTSITINVDTVAGSGTHTDWNITDGGESYFVSTWNSGANRRLNNVDSVFSDTCLIVHYPWDGGTVESGQNYGTPTKLVVGNWGIAGVAAPGNYYDNVEAFRSFYERTGIDTYWTWYTTLADNFWRMPAIDQGLAYSPQNNYQFAVRSQSLQGMMVRGNDPGMSAMWPGIRTIVTFDINTMNHFMSFGWAFIDQREWAAYPMLFTALDALVDPDPTFANSSKAELTSVMPLFTAGLNADGSFPSSFFTIANQTDQVAVVNGSATVVCATCSWTSATFAARTFATYDNYPTYPTTNVPYGAAYTPTFVNATTITLDRPYAGTTGTKGYALGNPVVGFGTQSFMEGIQGSAFVQTKLAIAASDPTTSALSGTYAQGVGGWLTTYGYADPAFGGLGGMYYFQNFKNCSFPTQTTICTAGFDASQSRTDAGEALKGLADAYLQAPTVPKLTFGNKLFDEMFCKPGTGGTCTTDGIWITDLDNGGFYLNTDSTTNKWFGFFFGYSNLTSWAAIWAAANGGGTTGGAIFLGPVTIQGNATIQ